MSSHLRLSLLGLALLSGGMAHAEPLREKPPLRALEYVYSAETNDYFYSIDASQIEAAIYAHGYDDLPGLVGTIGYVEPNLETMTAELRRFYKWQPETDHFYTIDPDEMAQVRNLGWADEGIEGHLYSTQVPGTRPVYRLSKWDPSTGDLVHYFATESWDIQAKLDQGYSNDGLAGYLYTSVTPNLAPAVAGGRILGRRCTASNAACSWPSIGYRDYYFNDGRNLPSTAPYYWSRSTHHVTFDYQSFDWSAETGHQDVMLRNSVKYDPNDISWGAYDGVGLIFSGANPWCGVSTHDRVVVEIWRPRADGRSTEALVDCSTLSTTRLIPGVKYSFALSSSDSGQFCYTIRSGTTTLESRCSNVKDKYEYLCRYVPQALKGDGCTDVNRYVKYPIPNFSTGANTYYSLLHAHDAQKDFTSYFTNVTSTWR